MYVIHVCGVVDAVGPRSGRLGPREACPVLPANGGLWWAVVGCGGRSWKAGRPVAPTPSLDLPMLADP